ncbi:MAG: TraB/GumN family protein [Proteobacteria bacterium]|nr:MAG: TraB/GumN family protein [Pseudomonadota bacterium]
MANTKVNFLKLFLLNSPNYTLHIGTLSPLPKRMDWNFKPIEEVIQSSQALLLPPQLVMKFGDIGFFKKLSLATSVIGIKKNPDKQKLIDVVPDDLYARWLVLKKKYMGRDRGIEKTRPIFASQELSQKALKKSGLTRKTGVTKKIKKTAKKHKLEFIIPTVEVDLENPKAKLKDFKKSELNDLECFAKTLQRLEHDLVAMRTRAVAWSDGDIETIKSLPYVDNDQACNSAWLNSEIAQDVGITDIRARTRTLWLEHAKATLTKHKSSFAILPMSHLLSDDSILEDLESAGYKIDAPKY